jgi:hypothetical protein
MHSKSVGGGFDAPIRRIVGLGREGNAFEIAAGYRRRSRGRSRSSFQFEFLEALYQTRRYHYLIA